MRKTNITFALFLNFLLQFFVTGGYAQFTFVHITDLHISDGTGNIGNYDDNGEQFFCNIQHFNTLYPKPAFIVVSGDISNIGSKSPDGMYDALTQYLFPEGGISNPANGEYFIDSAQTIPIYFVSGNHEYYESILLGLDQTEILQYYPANIAPDTDYSFIYNNTVLLFLRTGYDRPLWQDQSFAGVEGTGITADQCRWLRTTLSEADASGCSRKIIIMHHPLVNVAGTEVDGTPNTNNYDGLDDGSFLYNRETFMNICDSNNVDAVISGHCHQNVVVNDIGNVVDENWPDDTRYIQTAQSYDGAYRIFTVDSNFISVSLPMVVDCSTIGIESTESITCEIYPNPLTSSAVLVLSANDVINNYVLIITNTLGLEVKKIMNIHKGTNTIERGNLTPGLYFYTIYNPKGITRSGKLIIK